MAEYYEKDVYAFILYKIGEKKLRFLNKVDRDPMRVLEDAYGLEAKQKLEIFTQEYHDLEGDNWDNFCCWVDVQLGNIYTADQIGKEFGLSASTINKRLTALGFPKYNGNEDNPFGKRYIPEHIVDIIREVLENWKENRRESQ